MAYKPYGAYYKRAVGKSFALRKLGVFEYTGESYRRIGEYIVKQKYDYDGRKGGAVL